MIPIELKKCIGSPCEVRTMDNDLLSPGKVGAVGDETLDIVSSKGERMPLHYYNAPVKINIFSTSEGKFSLGGNIYISNEKFWRISNVTLFDNFEKRGFFRIRTDALGEILLHPEEEEAPEQMAHRLFPVKLLDVSLCGVGFVADCNLELGEDVLIRKLKMQEKEKEFSFLAKVRRKGMQRDAGTVYGVSIEEISEREMDRLCRIIFALQREEIQRRRNR